MVQFWNGNKSTIRQQFEWKVLQLALQKIKPNLKLNNDVTDYPKAEQEGQVFSQGTDVLVTVAGNKKFEQGSYLMLPQPLCRGLLGCRVLIIHKSRLNEFKALNEIQLKQLSIGIPATWADADLFRTNQYHVIEQGSLEDRLLAVQNGESDYMALGANEAEAIVTQYAHLVPDLVVEPTLLLYYPFPLVFYCHPEQAGLLADIEQGLAQCKNSGELDTLFENTYGTDVRAVKLHQRRVFHLTNPILPSELAYYQSDLLPI
ncbi:ABC transporter substrate-binding protein [Vibrio rotiferianus]|uniref:transporter substrate-binding domain-containing protein n=1 Tax=Vibrio rotiferianus TaxID=190895 RepID=UPI0002376BB0|nr:transporter substrate-binding domain-containing protein [Vibrio rotiferianus]ASI94288.1 ABC transporter substrate-binding protein [Vibrio rotiferianus]CAH1545481.1 ABC transporter substrate-binding protein [Vibrio rotiferianus]